MSQLKKGAILSYVNIIFTTLIGLLITPFIIRTLGNSEYGLYTLIGSFVAYLSLMDLGLNNTIVRYVSRYRAQNDLEGERKFLGATLLIYLAISIALVILGLIFYFNLSSIFSKSLTPDQLSDAKIMFLILIFNLAITLPGGSFTAICNAYERFIFPRALNIIKYLLRSATVIAVLLLGGKSIGLVVIDTVFNILVILATGFFVFKKLKIRFAFRGAGKVQIKEIFSYSVWIFLMGIISQFQWNSGQIILGIQVNTVTVAIYGVGIMLGGYYGAFSSAISSVFLPRASQMSLNNTNEEILEMMIKVGRISFMFLMLILTGFILFGKEFIFLWIGKEYNESWRIALIIMIVYTIPLIQNFANAIVEAKNRVAFKVKVYSVFFTIGCIAGYLLIPVYGATGIVLGISLGWFLAQVVMNLFFHKILHLKVNIFFNAVFHKTLLPIAILCITFNYFNQFFAEGWISLICKTLIYSLLYIVVMYFYCMNSFERKLIIHKSI